MLDLNIFIHSSNTAFVPILAITAVISSKNASLYMYIYTWIYWME